MADSRTTEVLWNGNASLPFMLKRKRTGAILVTKLKENRIHMRGAVALRLGSELKLVGGFPVQHLTLGEVKKLMVKAPKPVSLVFLHHDDVVLDNSSFLSSEDGRSSFEHDYESGYEDEFNNNGAHASTDMSMFPVPRESGEWHDMPAGMPERSMETMVSCSSADEDASIQSSTATSSNSPMGPTVTTRRRRRSPDRKSLNAPPRKVSKLKQALDRMNELLNRPVRRSGLNVSAGKSTIVV
ncbi:hypothetical protein Poli38472_007112 [Pythium oligandrum]|uniref:Uncharacterized protein n=1 Tax=Pythium oligandrum TaxID=41045 RepID=A0A8K1FGR1_PYTOL|nr:hypothetical protein Poli38472_007112 [Pythium oligandrum]|eukprot:TMW58967.1 hypothetical protein Poli38472_007112 [Pythium oligandrum]